MTKILFQLPALVNPSTGLIFWMTITFVTVLFLLKKFAWKPMMEFLEEREKNIENSLQQAENAKAEMAQLKSENENLLAEARAEKDTILKEARQMKDKIIADAKTMADEEAKKLIQRANEEIEKQKNSAIEELRKEVAGYSIQIAEKLVQKELSNADAQKSLIDEQLKQMASSNTAKA